MLTLSLSMESGLCRTTGSIIIVSTFAACSFPYIPAHRPSAPSFLLDELYDCTEDEILLHVPVLVSSNHNHSNHSIHTDWSEKTANMGKTSGQALPQAGSRQVTLHTGVLEFTPISRQLSCGPYPK